MLYCSLTLVQVDILAGLFITHAIIEEKIAYLFFGFPRSRGDKDYLDPIAGREKAELLTSRYDLQLPIWGPRITGEG
jgi:hypothetical protein